MNDRRQVWLAVAWCLLVMPADARAAKPEATFAPKEDWIEARIERDARPLGGVRIQVFDPAGTPFAEGETGDDGVGSFPRPRGHTCLVGVTVEGKECDVIRLRFDAATGVLPSRVQLTFKDRSCCRAAFVGPIAETCPSGEGHVREGQVRWLGAAGGGCLLAAVVVVLATRRPHQGSPDAPTAPSPGLDRE